MNPSHFRTVFEHQQALARAGESARTEADPTPEPTLFVSPSAHEKSPPFSPSTNDMARQLLSSIQSGAPSGPIAQRRSARVRKTVARRTGNAEEITKRRVGDIYGFMDVDDGSANEI